MRASRTTRRAAPRASRARKHAAPLVSKSMRKIAKVAPVPVEPLAYRFCKSGWAVLVEQQPNQQGTRFVCPFCSVSHRVSGPVRGFRKIKRAQWVKLRRVEE